MTDKNSAMCRELRCYTLEAKEVLLTMDHPANRDGNPVLVRPDDVAISGGPVAVKDVPAIGPADAPKLVIPLRPLSNAEEHFLTTARRAGFHLYRVEELNLDTSQKLARAFSAHTEALRQYVERRRGQQA